MARFDGKPVIKVKVSDGIHKSQELIERAVKGDGPIYHHEGGKAASTASEGDESFGRQIYKHLMNGVSNMLPFVIGGGIPVSYTHLMYNQTIDMVIRLEDWNREANYDRLGLDEEYIEFLGNKVVCYSIPIRPGRNLAVIVERCV